MQQGKQEDGKSVWEYILLYTDNVLEIGCNPKRMLRHDLGQYFELKEERIVPPNIYFGGRGREMLLEN